MHSTGRNEDGWFRAWWLKRKTTHLSLTNALGDFQTNHECSIKSQTRTSNALARSYPTTPLSYKGSMSQIFFSLLPRTYFICSYYIRVSTRRTSVDSIWTHFLSKAASGIDYKNHNCLFTRNSVLRRTFTYPETYQFSVPFRTRLGFS